MATDYPIRYTGTPNQGVFKTSLEYSAMEHLHPVNNTPSPTSKVLVDQAVQRIQNSSDFRNTHVRLYRIEGTTSGGGAERAVFTVTGDLPYYGVGVEPNFGLHRFVATGMALGNTCSISNLAVARA